MPGTQKPAAAVDLSDPLQVAVKVTSVEGSLALLSQQVSQGLGNLQSQLSAMQGDMRAATDKLADLAATQHEIQAHSTGLDRLAKAIEESTKENMEWRRVHEEKNSRVADSVTTARGAMWALGIAGGLVIGLVVFTVQMQFTSATQDRQRIEKAHNTDIDRIERRIDKADAEREEIKKMRDLK